MRVYGNPRQVAEQRVSGCGDGPHSDHSHHLDDAPRTGIEHVREIILRVWPPPTRHPAALPPPASLAGQFHPRCMRSGLVVEVRTLAGGPQLPIEVPSSDSCRWPPRIPEGGAARGPRLVTEAWPLPESEGPSLAELECLYEESIQEAVALLRICEDGGRKIGKIRTSVHWDLQQATHVDGGRRR